MKERMLDRLDTLQKDLDSLYREVEIDRYDKALWSIRAMDKLIMDLFELACIMEADYQRMVRDKEKDEMRDLLDEMEGEEL